MKPVYLDYAATTPADDEVVKAMLPFFGETFANPSSVHTPGQKARTAVEKSRSRVAALLGAAAEEIIFTSGGTESDNLALKGLAAARRDFGDHIVTSAIEHHAVLRPCETLERQGFRVTRVKVDATGMVDPGDVKKALTEKTILISIMHANNEIGTIQPIGEIGRIARERGVVFHTDAVQTFGHLPIDVDRLNIDALSASGHKFYGPKGVGFLYLRKGTRILPQMEGGEQERDRRASTHNVPGIAGLGKAVELAGERMAAEAERLAAMRDRAVERILTGIERTHLNGHPRLRLPNNVNIRFDGVEGEALLFGLDMAGIACSSGSACTSSSVDPSHVLAAIGLQRQEAHSSLRFSLGRGTADGDVDRFLDVLTVTVARLRALAAGRGARG
ncbi:MAG: Cysteine desulfurase [Syntrophaceae bacterium PtaU1.Bin231]|nr:MAG: Cysteine desulfurase [Syntrophaceae bacterium PtaU1.Bin231]HOG18044.1 cysteine desulfurase NifS [Syntrophales bacterium]